MESSTREITGCNDCPFKYKPKSNWENDIEICLLGAHPLERDVKPYPLDCPLLTQTITVKLKISNDGK